MRFQFLICSVISMRMVLFIEKISLSGIYQAIIPILYGVICSVGIAHTLQIVGQKNANPSYAAITLSFENGNLFLRLVLRSILMGLKTIFFIEITSYQIP